MLKITTIYRIEQQEVFFAYTDKCLDQLFRAPMCGHFAAGFDSHTFMLGTIMLQVTYNCCCRVRADYGLVDCLMRQFVLRALSDAIEDRRATLGRSPRSAASVVHSRDSYWLRLSQAKGRELAFFKHGIPNTAHTGTRKTRRSSQLVDEKLNKTITKNRRDLRRTYVWGIL